VEPVDKDDVRADWLGARVVQHVTLNTFLRFGCLLYLVRPLNQFARSEFYYPKCPEDGIQFRRR
jgi:hypothetical protein